MRPIQVNFVSFESVFKTRKKGGKFSWYQSIFKSTICIADLNSPAEFENFAIVPDELGALAGVHGGAAKVATFDTHPYAICI